ncbi:MAG: ABC transporter permease [Candidatus Aminicenantes bacterium]|nr:ABC transporter permease [Candidatus Aminicenantes bacterium]
MFNNYIKVVLRNISRNKLYSFLNIAGLAIGIACCILILLYVQDELSYDRFHENADRIYRVNSHFSIKDRVMNFATTAHVQGPLLKDEYPEVENYVRFNGYGSPRVIRYRDKRFTEEKFLWVDHTVFDVFSFKLLKGNPKQALKEPNTVVITEEMAKKYFGPEDPVDKKLRIHNDTYYTVTGVVQDIPANSYFQPDFMASFSSLKLKPSGNVSSDLVSNVDYYTYLLLREGTGYKDLEEKFAGFVDKYLTDLLKALGGSVRFELQPLTRIYLHSDRQLELERTGDISYIYLFSGIGLFILLLACLNFMNLSTARSANRAKEVGLRKVMGARRSQLIRQFLGESLILTLFSIVIALILVYALLPTFNNISGKELTTGYFSNPYLLIGLTGLFLFAGLLGGSYPAFFLSAFRPVSVLQGKLKKGAKGSLLRIILVSLQFTVSIVLIIGIVIINKQLNFVHNQKLGYDKDQVIALRVRNEETQKKIEVVKNELLRHPDITHVSASSSLPLGRNSFTAHHVVGKPKDELIMLYSQIVDEDFLDTYKMKLLQGRNFSKDYSTDPGESIIINEAAAKRLGWIDNALGKEIEIFMSINSMKKYKIVGVVKDYHFQSLHEKIQPLVLYNANPHGGNYYRLSIRSKSKNIQAILSFIESKWREFDSKYPFEYVFLDDQYESLYRTEERLGQLFGYFTALAIIIGCLGLFGLSTFSAEQRTKEIGIRKVVGATIPNVILLLVREFTKWVFLAVFIAWPLGYFIMNKWLQNFAYRTKLGFDTFLLSALLALLIALLTVTYQAAKTALANPVDSLKYE